MARRPRPVTSLALCAVTLLPLLSIVVLCSPVRAVEPPLRDETYGGGQTLWTNIYLLVVNTGRGILNALFNWTSDSEEKGPARTTLQSVPSAISALADERLPDPPAGAHLVQLYACAGVNASVPMFVNDAWMSDDRKKTVERVFITQHGAAYDPDRYFGYVNKYVNDDKTLVIAPAFYRTTTRPAPSSWYLPDINLAWSARPDEWPVGTNAASPRNVVNKANTRCSSFAAFDTLLDALADKAAFPKLTNVTLMGHSGGGNMVSRYAQLNSHQSDLHIRYLVMNPANHAFLSDARPIADADSCEPAFRYPYQLDPKANNLPTWVMQQLSTLLSGLGLKSTTTQQLFTRWAARDVVLLVGEDDTSKSGTQKCQSVVQGGSARRDRNYGFWTYLNILAGRADAVKDGLGYNELVKSGAQAMTSGQTVFNHQYCVVPNVAHDEPGLLASACGQAALFNQALPS